MKDTLEISENSLPDEIKKRLPFIPDKNFFSIGEASKLCDVKEHTLRSWEKSFPCISPTKRKGQRRYYQQPDILWILYIRSLSKEHHLSEAEIRKLLSNQSFSKTKTYQYFVQQIIDEISDIIVELEKSGA